PVLLERPTKSPPRPQAARGARLGSALRLASTPAPSPAPWALQVTRRHIPALPAAQATTTRDSATRKQRAPEPSPETTKNKQTRNQPAYPKPANQPLPQAPLDRLMGCASSRGCQKPRSWGMMRSSRAIATALEIRTWTNQSFSLKTTTTTKMLR
ncbi:mCG125297, partial [Mus musculus]